MSAENIFLKNKSIIIVIPNDFGLPESFKKNLEFLGMQVHLLPYSDDYKSLTFSDRIKHTLCKIFKKDRSYKKRVLEHNRMQSHRIIHHKILSTISDKTDYALLLRPDLLHDDVIEKIKQSTKKMIAYQWDGLDRYPDIKSKVKYFDHFFVFDKKDLSYNSKFKLINNFYFDYDLTCDTVSENDVFFIGSHIDNRMPKLKEISLYLKENNFKTSINVMGSSRRYIRENPQSGIHHIGKALNFQENYDTIKKSTAILDLVNNVHNGLSFRVFESIGLKKKLITNNSEVKNYDFYDENNIFVLGDRKLEDLKEFISTPYRKIDDTIMEKYSFTNWIYQILEVSV